MFEKNQLDTVEIVSLLIISMTNPSYFNYDNYVGMDIREIQTMSTETFITCRAYNHYNSNNYYPFIKPFLGNHTNILTPVNEIKMVIRDENYVSYEYNLGIGMHYTKIRNKMECFDERIRSLRIDAERLTFNDTTIAICLRNITYVHIKSINLEDISNTTFFDIVPNIVYLKLETEVAIKIVPCDNFAKLRQLRALEIIGTTHFKINLICVFEYNEDLVKISTHFNRIWNLCNGVVEEWNSSGRYQITNYQRSRNTYDKIHFIIYFSLPVLIIIPAAILFQFIAKKVACKTETGPLFDEYLV